MKLQIFNNEQTQILKELEVGRGYSFDYAVQKSRTIVKELYGSQDVKVRLVAAQKSSWI